MKIPFEKIKRGNLVLTAHGTIFFLIMRDVVEWYGEFADVIVEHGLDDPIRWEFQ